MKSTRSLLSLAVLFGLFVLLAFAVAPASADSPFDGQQCFDPWCVKKTAIGTYESVWDWSIVKTGPEKITLGPGDTGTADYQVIVTATPSEDVRWTVTGVLDVRNLTSADLWLRDVEDELSDGTTATVTCPFTFPIKVETGNTVPVCTYTATGTGSLPESNTARLIVSATQDGATYVATTRVVTVTDNGPTGEYDECIDVTDDQYGSLGEVCASDSPKTFNYSTTVGPYEACGEYVVVNVASFTTKDSGKTGSSTHTTPVHVPCDEKCYADETAWAAGTRYVSRGNWATFTPYVADSTVTLYAGQTYVAGTVHFGPVVGGNVTITITLNPGFQFDPDTNESVKIQGYATAPTGISPNPGGFANKGDAETSPFVIVVPAANYYGVHVDVEREIACPV
jgi:hypothetical protein